MPNKNDNNFLKRLMANQIFVTIVGLVILVFLGTALARNLSQAYRVNKEINDLKSEITKVEGRNTYLKQMLKYLDSNEFVEKEARMSLGLQKPGETAVAIKDLPNSENKGGEIFNTYDSGNSNSKIAKTNQERWLDYFWDKL